MQTSFSSGRVLSCEISVNGEDPQARLRAWTSVGRFWNVFGALQGFSEPVFASLSLIWVRKLISFLLLDNAAEILEIMGSLGYAGTECL